MVETVLDGIGLLADLLLFLTFLDGGCLFEQALLFLGLGLGLVFVEQLEGLRCRVAVQCVGELRDRRRDFETQVQDFLLPLQAYVFGPFHHAREIASRLDVLANAKVARSLFDEWVLFRKGCSSSVSSGVVGRGRIIQQVQWMSNRH